MGIALLSLLAFGCTSSPENGPQCNAKEQSLSLNGKWSLSYWKQNQDEEALCPKAVKPENTIKQVAFNMGFENVSSLGRYFRNFTHVSPKKFRATYAQNMCGGDEAMPEE